MLLSAILALLPITNAQLPVTQDPALIGQYKSITQYEENQRRVYWNQYQAAGDRAEQEATNYHIWRTKQDYIIRGSQYFPDGITPIQGNENPDSVNVALRTPEYFGHLLFEQIYATQTTTPQEIFRQARLQNGKVKIKLMTNTDGIDEEHESTIGSNVDFSKQMIWWNTNQLATFTALIDDSSIGSFNPQCNTDLTNDEFLALYVTPNCQDPCSCFYTSTQEESCRAQCKQSDIDNVLSCEFNKLLFKLKKLVLENLVNFERERVCVGVADLSLLGLTVTEQHPLGLDSAISIGAY